MPKRQTTTTPSVLCEAGRYPLDAFHFLKEGLDFSVRQVHGAPSRAHDQVIEFMHRRGMDPDRLRTLYNRRKLPASIAAKLEEIGGPDGLESRHINGPQLCRGLRDLALQKWGLMASVVLARWNIRSTRDFGVMVFALVEEGILRKCRHDRIDDFDDVFDFEDAFDRAYHIRMSAEA